MIKSEIECGLPPPTAMNAILSENPSQVSEFGLPDTNPSQSAYICNVKTQKHKPPDHWKVNYTGPCLGDINYKPKFESIAAKPIVDKYSITRYSVPEWQRHNKEVLKGDIIPESNVFIEKHILVSNVYMYLIKNLEFKVKRKISDLKLAFMEKRKVHRTASITKNCIEQVRFTVKKDFDDNTKQLQQRANHIYYWKCELKHGINNITKEIHNLEVQRQRLKTAMAKILLPESIGTTKECCILRGQRLEPDLVQDPPQDELIMETSLIMEIQQSFERLLTEIQRQLEINVTAKEQMEFDYSDKKVVFKYENKNVDLSYKSTVVRNVAGVAKIHEGQSDVDFWESFSKEGISKGESAIRQSTRLREKIDATLLNAGRDLRTQHDIVNNALAKKIAATDQLRIELEKQLTVVLEKTVETEIMVENLKDELNILQQQLRVSQTRLYNKHWFGRPNVENCREHSQIGLIEEVQQLNDALTLMKARLEESNRVLNKLVKERGDLEQEITVKRKSLKIDRDRCLTVRSHYPSTTTLCGY